MIWYPYQQMKTMQTPYEIVDAEGVYLYTRERRMIEMCIRDRRHAGWRHGPR